MLVIERLHNLKNIYMYHRLFIYICNQRLKSNFYLLSIPTDYLNTCLLAFQQCLKFEKFLTAHFVQLRRKYLESYYVPQTCQNDVECRKWHHTVIMIIVAIYIAALQQYVKPVYNTAQLQFIAAHLCSDTIQAPIWNFHTAMYLYIAGIEFSLAAVKVPAENGECCCIFSFCGRYH